MNLTSSSMALPPVSSVLSSVLRPLVIDESIPGTADATDRASYEHLDTGDPCAASSTTPGGFINEPQVGEAVAPSASETDEFDD